MSVAAAAKARLVGADGVLAGLLDGVPVAYSAPTRDMPREVVYGGSVAGPVELAAFAAGGRVKRNEDLTLLLHVRVYQQGKRTAETAEARAVEIGDVIGNYIAQRWKLSNPPSVDDLPDLMKATVAGVELDSWLDDDGAGATLSIAVGLTSRLS